MTLSPEIKSIGRRNFIKAVGGVPPLMIFGAAAALRGPIKGGPVKAGLIGTGDQGRVLLGQCRKEYIDVKAICDINSLCREQARKDLLALGRTRPTEYEDWREMLAKEEIEAVLIATPLWCHAEMTMAALQASKHVLCEKMMAYDVDGCRQMLAAARKNRRVLEIGYNGCYTPSLQTAYETVIRPKLLGDITALRLVYHRHKSWRREVPKPENADVSRWGYPTWDHLANWRLYRRYSRGKIAELSSHQINLVNWFLDATPVAVQGSGGIHCFKDGREVHDHVYAILEYPNDLTATCSAIESNKFDHDFIQFMGTQGTLILHGPDILLFHQDEEKRGTVVEVSPQAMNPVMDASASRVADASGRAVGSGTRVGGGADGLDSYALEIARFCAAIRTGTRLACTPERALRTAVACLTTVEAIDRKVRLHVPKVTI